jgi:hypothetical protein
MIAETRDAMERFISTLEGMIARSHALLVYMHKGATMTQIRSKDLHLSRVFLSDDSQIICWDSDKKGETPKLALASVKFIRVGQCTATFRKARNVAQYERLSFSLIYGDAFETLDLICQREDDYERWVEGLQMLVVGAADRLVCVGGGGGYG